MKDRSMKDLGPNLASSPGDLTDFEQNLLDAAAHDQIPDPLKRRMSRALQMQLAAAATLTAADAAAQGTAAAKTSSLGAGGGLLFSKTVTIGIASALLAAGAIGWHQLNQNAVKPTAATETLTPAMVGEDPISQPKAAEAPAVTIAEATSLHDEIVLLDSARDAVKTSQPARALELLTRYETRFPSGALVPEAAALRIEALVQSGANAHAKQLAERFLASYPSSPLAQRVERLAPRRSAR